MLGWNRRYQIQCQGLCSPAHCSTQSTAMVSRSELAGRDLKRNDQFATRFQKKRFPLSGRKVSVSS